MGIFDFLSVNSDDTPNPTNTIEVGREAMKFFHNQNTKYADYTMTFEQLLSQVAGRGGNDQQVAIFLDGLGFSINTIRNDGFLAGGSDVQKSMESLADKAQGKVPTQASFFKAISDKASSPSFIDTVGAVSVGTASEIGKGAVAVGESVIETGKALTQYLPFIAIGGIALFVYMKVKKSA